MAERLGFEFGQGSQTKSASLSRVQTSAGRHFYQEELCAGDLDGLRASFFPTIIKHLHGLIE